MLKKGNFSKRKSSRPKVSEMVPGFGGDYISMGKDIEEKQEYLNSGLNTLAIRS